MAPGIKYRKDVITFLSSKLAGRKKISGEPRWGIPQICIEAAKALRLDNFKEISAAIGLSPAPADDLRAVRNFAVHPNEKTAREFQRVVKSSNLPASIRVHSLVNSLVFPGIKIFASWVKDLRLMAQLSIR